MVLEGEGSVVCHEDHTRVDLSPPRQVAEEERMRPPDLDLLAPVIRNIFPIFLWILQNNILTV